MLLQAIADSYKKPFWEQGTGIWDDINNVGLRWVMDSGLFGGLRWVMDSGLFGLRWVMDSGLLD